MTRYKPNRKAIERAYRRALRQIARRVGEIIERANVAEYPQRAAQVRAELAQYADQLREWAENAGHTMVKAAEREDKRLWRAMGTEMSRDLHRKVMGQDMRATRDQLVQQQIDLIQSIPADAAERVSQLSLEAQAGGSRGEDIRRMLLESTSVTASHAELIARTETARATSKFTQTRAESVGSTEFIWRTAGDSDVRPGHRAMANRVFRWDTPPAVDEGDRTINHLPGAIWNCFTGDTPVDLSTGALDIFRTPFSGPILDIEIDGSVMSVTENHPIMTVDGWKSAGEINIGDQIIQRVGDNGVRGHDDIKQSMPTFDDLFIALGGAIQHHAVPVDFDFHGDVPGDHVDQISLDGHLTANGPTEALKRTCNLALTESDSRVAQIGIVGGEPHVFTPATASGGNKIAPLIQSEVAHSDSIGFTSTSGGDAAVAQPILNSKAGNAITLGQGQNTDTLTIERNNLAVRKIMDAFSDATWNSDAPGADMLAQNVGVMSEGFGNRLKGLPGAYGVASVRNIFVRDFSGHVYTISSSSGWYSVTQGRFIVKNCRCFSEPLIPA